MPEITFVFGPNNTFFFDCPNVWKLYVALRRWWVEELSRADKKQPWHSAVAAAAVQQLDGAGVEDLAAILRCACAADKCA